VGEPDPAFPREGAITPFLVTLVVITRNRAAEVTAHAPSWFAQTHRPLQIVFVDDASTDDTPRALSALRDGAPPGVEVLLVRNDRRLGIGGARNAGIREARGEFIAFTDDDCEGDPDWLAGLSETLRSDPGILVAGGRVKEPPAPTLVQRAAEGLYWLGTRERDVPAVIGCNMAYRASFLRENPFDAGAHYGDDLDRCFSARSLGGRVRYNPRAAVVHHHRRGLASFLGQQVRRGKGSVWVRRKHRRGLWPRKNWVVLALLLSPALAIFTSGPLAWAVPAGLLGLLAAQVVALDLTRGRTLSTSVRMLPLSLLGYFAEFAGAVAALLCGGRQI
jgi:GT2 family glycosyltransferase